MKQNVVLASGNLGKVQEMKPLLEAKGWQLSLQSDYGVIQPEETGSTFIENAIIKARAVCEQTGFAAIADDSGLVVDALKGAPGVLSARFAGAQASDAQNNVALLSAMSGVVESLRSAYFVSVIVLMRHATDPLPLIATGVWHGSLLSEPLGEGGFGYDPLFWVPTHQCSSAQLPAEVKQRISHRGQALASLLAQLS